MGSSKSVYLWPHHHLCFIDSLRVPDIRSKYSLVPHMGVHFESDGGCRRGNSVDINAVIAACQVNDNIFLE